MDSTRNVLHLQRGRVEGEGNWDMGVRLDIWGEKDPWKTGKIVIEGGVRAGRTSHYEPK